MPKDATTVLFSAEERVLVDTDFMSLVSCGHAPGLTWVGQDLSVSCRCCAAQ